MTFSSIQISLICGRDSSHALHHPPNVLCRTAGKGHFRPSQRFNRAACFVMGNCQLCHDLCAPRCTHNWQQAKSCVVHFAGFVIMMLALQKIALSNQRHRACGGFHGDGTSPFPLCRRFFCPSEYVQCVRQSPPGVRLDARRPSATQNRLKRFGGFGVLLCLKIPCAGTLRLKESQPVIQERNDKDHDEN